MIEGIAESSRSSSCSEVFQSVCDTIGQTYVERGFRYSRSRPRITAEDAKIRLDIGLWSSSLRNTPGKRVILEMVPIFYSKDLPDTPKRGLLFGHPGILSRRKLDNSSRLTEVHQVYGDTLVRAELPGREPRLAYNNCCNVYGIDSEQLSMITGFIDSKILVWFQDIQEEKGLEVLLRGADRTAMWSLFGTETDPNSNFIQYLARFPSLDLRDLVPEECRTDYRWLLS